MIIVWDKPTVSGHRLVETVPTDIVPLDEAITDDQMEQAVREADKFHGDLEEYESEFDQRVKDAVGSEDSEKYCDFGCNALDTYLKDNPEIDVDKFTEYAIVHNKADRDAGELQDIGQEEVERLGEEFSKEAKYDSRDSSFGKAYWVDPDGTIYPVDYAHADWVDEHRTLLTENFGYEGEITEYTLKDSGWLRVLVLPHELRINVGSLVDVPDTLDGTVASLWNPEMSVSVDDDNDSILIQKPERSIKPQIERQMRRLIHSSAEYLNQVKAWFTGRIQAAGEAGLDYHSVFADMGKTIDEYKGTQESFLDVYADLVESGSIEERGNKAYWKTVEKKAASGEAYWVDPNGEEYILGEESHMEWCELNTELLMDKGIPVREFIEDQMDSMFEHGWSRVVPEEGSFTNSDYQFSIQVGDLGRIPSGADMFVAKHFKQNGSPIIVDDKKYSSVKVYDPFPSLQKSVNKALQKKRLGSKGEAPMAEHIRFDPDTHFYEAKDENANPVRLGDFETAMWEFSRTQLEVARNNPGQWVEVAETVLADKEAAMEKKAQYDFAVTDVLNKGSHYAADIMIPRSATKHHDLRRLNTFLKAWVTDNTRMVVNRVAQRVGMVESEVQLDLSQEEFFPNVTDEQVTFEVKFTVATLPRDQVTEEASMDYQWRPTVRASKIAKAFYKKALELWKHPKDYMGATWEGYYVGPSRTRDSKALENSNFDAALKMLGGEDEEKGVEVARANHWAVGWVETIMVRQDAKDKVAILESVEKKMGDYPVLDEDDFSDREYQEWESSYDSWGKDEVLNEIGKYLGDESAADTPLTPEMEENLHRVVLDHFSINGGEMGDVNRVIKDLEESGFINDLREKLGMDLEKKYVPESPNQLKMPFGSQKTVIKGRYNLTANLFELAIGKEPIKEYLDPVAVTEAISKVASFVDASSFLDEMKGNVDRFMERCVVKEATQKQAGLEPGTRVTVKPTASGLIESYPAAKWLTEEMEVTLKDYAPNANTLDVIDVVLPDGREESIYDFNIIKPEANFDDVASNVEDNTTEHDRDMANANYPGRPTDPMNLDADSNALFECTNCGAPMGPLDQSHLIDRDENDESIFSCNKKTATDDMGATCQSCGKAACVCGGGNTEKSCSLCKVSPAIMGSNFCEGCKEMEQFELNKGATEEKIAAMFYRVPDEIKPQVIQQLTEACRTETMPPTKRILRDLIKEIKESGCVGAMFGMDTFEHYTDFKESDLIPDDPKIADLHAPSYFCDSCDRAFEPSSEGHQDICPNCGAVGNPVPLELAAAETEKGYQGWTNYSTWGLALHLDNEQDIYNESREMASNARDAAELATELKERYSNLLEEKGESDKHSDEVNWREIAEDLIDEVKENKDYDRSQGAGGVIDKLPTMDIEKSKSDLIDQLNAETDPEKKKSLERRYKHLTMALLKRKADADFADPEAEGEVFDEPCEGDIFIKTEGPLGAQYAAYQDGKLIARSVEWEDIEKEVKAKMEADQFWPTVWFQDDHGGMQRVTFASMDKGAVAPPGWESTVKKMKKHKDIDNPWALAWSMKNKGNEPHPHKKSSWLLKEAVNVGPSDLDELDLWVNNDEGLYNWCRGDGIDVEVIGDMENEQYAAWLKENAEEIAKAVNAYLNKGPAEKTWRDYASLHATAGLADQIRSLKNQLKSATRPDKISAIVDALDKLEARYEKQKEHRQ